MSTQTSLLDAIAARERAITGCEENNLDWCGRAFVKLQELARTQSTVLVEELREAMGDDQPHTLSAYGPCMLRGAREGILRRQPGVRTALSTRSHSERATWASLLFSRAS